MVLLLLALALATAPSKPVVSGPHSARAGVFTFRFSSHEAGVKASRLRYRCTVDRHTPRPCTSPYDVQLRAGRHLLRVQAIDPKGRRSPFGQISVLALGPAPSVEVGREPVALTFAQGALWTADYGGGTVTRVDGGRVTARIQVGGLPGGVAGAGGSLWVGSFEPDGRLTRIDPATNQVAGRVSPGGQPAGLLGDGNVLWVADYSGSVLRLDASTGDVVARIPIGGQPEALTLGFGLLWVTNQDGTITAVDPVTNAVAGEKVTGDDDMDAVSAGSDSLWSTSYYDGTLLQIDPSTRKVLRRIQLGASGGGVLAAGGAVWASVYGSAEVVRVDAGSGRISRRVPVGDKPRDIVSDGSNLWVVNQGSDSISRLGSP